MVLWNLLLYKQPQGYFLVCEVVKRKKRKYSSETRLDKLAKGAFVKVESMAWDVWIHACSHGFLGCGYGFERCHGHITMLFLLNNTW